jgi:hypothetical protein
MPLAGLGICELAAAAGTTSRTIHRLETGGIVQVAEKKRHGYVQRALWERIIAALAAAGVELLPQGTSFGAGVRRTAPAGAPPIKLKRRRARAQRLRRN